MANQSSVDDKVKAPSPALEVQKEARLAAVDLEKLHGERETLLARQRSIMELLGCSSPERILHDIRNVLNERALLRALAGIEDDPKAE